MAFYKNVDRVQDLMERYGITAAEIAQGKAMVAAIGSLQARQLHCKSQKHHATRQQRAALRALHSWVRDFLYVARFVMKDEPALMVALGQRV